MVPELSVVIPMYNEEEVLPLLVERLRPLLDDMGVAYEVVAVDDGSSDLTAALLQRHHRDWPDLRVVRLRANAGHQAAISAGLVTARGDYVVTIDADLQDPPEVMAQMLAVAKRDGVDVVYGVRNDRSTDTWFKRVSAGGFYRLIGMMSQTGAQPNAGDFRLMSRATVDAINSLPEHNRVLRFIVPALNFPSQTVEYRREERAAGSSKYPLMKMIRLSVDSLTGFSTAPLRMATLAGVGGAVLAVLILVYGLVARAQGHAVAGWTSTVAIVAGVGAVQLVCVGILGEYIGRMYALMQGRPTYFIAYDSLAGSGQVHGPTDTPLPAARRGANLVAGLALSDDSHRAWPMTNPTITPTADVTGRSRGSEQGPAATSAPGSGPDEEADAGQPVHR